MSQLDAVQNVKNSVYQQAGIREITIKGDRYQIQLLPSFTAFAVGMELIKTFLPAFGSYIDSGKKAEFTLPEEDDMFSEIAILLTRQMDQVNLVQMAQQLLEGLTCNGREVDANQHFRGSISGFIAILEFAMKENFSDFFTDYLKDKGLKIHSLGDLMGNREEEGQDKSES